MKISSSTDLSSPEGEVSGQATEFVSLGEELIQGTSAICLESAGAVDRFYPIALKSLKCVIDSGSVPPATIRLNVANQSLLITGDSKALRNLGQSLINVFTGATSDEHMHLEHYDGNQLVALSGCTVVFTCAEGAEK